MYLKVRSGAITESKISMSCDETVAEQEATAIAEVLDNCTVDETDFEDRLNSISIPSKQTEILEVARWLNRMLGRPG